MNPKRKTYTPINVEEFKNNITKERAYFLGFLWADGSIVRTSISIEIKSTDMEELIDIFNHSFEWAVYHRSRLNRSPQTTISRTNKSFNSYLRDHDYHIKSRVSPNKILATLTDEMKKYFFRGFIDGDGSFYHNKRGYLKQFSIGGSYYQDWSAITKLFDSLSIASKVCHRISKLGHKDSYVRITNTSDIQKLYDYLYDPKDGIYLTRKLDKCEEILGIVERPVSLCYDEDHHKVEQNEI